MYGILSDYSAQNNQFSVSQMSGLDSRLTLTKVFDGVVVGNQL
jgi:hypothetical protein